MPGLEVGDDGAGTQSCVSADKAGIGALVDTKVTLAVLRTLQIRSLSE